MDKSSIYKNTGKAQSREIGCVIVNYNTPEIITRAINSIKNYVDQIIIVDGSDMRNPAYLECDELEIFNSNVEVIHVGFNIGHGPGLNKGIERLKTEFIICMDSDAVLINNRVIDEMINAIDEDAVYGAGLVVTTDINGNNSKQGINYLHPYFCMFRKEEFEKYSPFINHGAPFIKTMNEINGKLEVMNIDRIQEKVWHEHRRTIEIAGLGWYKNWDKTC